MKWLKRLFGKLKSTKTEEGPAAAPPAATGPATQVEKPTPEPAESDSDAETPTAAEVDAEPVKTEAVAEPAKAEPVAEAVTESAAEVAEPEPVAEAAKSEPEAAPEAPPATDPALSTLDAAELQPAADESPFGPGSAKPLADGAAPAEDYTVKGKRSSKLFHTAESPYFGRTKADVWFKTPADAESAGFAAWNHKKKAAATK